MADVVKFQKQQTQKKPVAKYLASGVVIGESFPRTALDGIRYCLDHMEQLSPWEQSFIRALSRYTYLSDKQIDRVVYLVNRIKAEK